MKEFIAKEFGGMLRDVPLIQLDRGKSSILMIEASKQAAYLWLKEHPSSENALKIATGNSTSLTSGDLLAFFREIAPAVE